MKQYCLYRIGKVLIIVLALMVFLSTNENLYAEYTYYTGWYDTCGNVTTEDIQIDNFYYLWIALELVRRENL